LKALPTDPALVFELYPQLYASSFLVPIQLGSEADIETALFMIYAATDGILEVPIFTSVDCVFDSLPAEAVLVTANGDALWPQLLELLRSEASSQDLPIGAGAIWTTSNAGPASISSSTTRSSPKCEVAVDPGQSHSVRLTKETILGMIRAYGVQ
jgi:hypothetical protein